jgi:hypothetical protein
MSDFARRSLRYLLGLFLSVCSINIVAAQDRTLAPANAIPQGTLVLIQLTDRLDTQTAKAGDRFQARLAEPLSAENGMTIDAGRKVRGHVSAVVLGLQRRLLLSFDEIETSHGWRPLLATVTGVPGEHGLREVGDEGEIGRKAITKEQFAEAVVVSAGEAAEQGMHDGGKKAAAVAAGSGALDGAISAFASQHDLALEKGTALELRLDRNLSIPR